MAAGHIFKKTPQRVMNVRKGLPGAGLGKEDHEIDGIAFVQCDPDFGLVLEAADAAHGRRAGQQ